jgi:hypothetical protein
MRSPHPNVGVGELAFQSLAIEVEKTLAVGFIGKWNLDCKVDSSWA